MQMIFEHTNLENTITNTEICVCLGVAAATGVIAYVTLKVLFKDYDNNYSSYIKEDEWFDMLLALIDKSVSELPEILDICDAEIVCYTLGFKIEGLLHLLNGFRFLLEQKQIMPDLASIHTLSTFLECVDILKHQLYFTEHCKYDTILQIGEVCKETAFDLFKPYPNALNPIIEANFGVVDRPFFFTLFK